MGVESLITDISSKEKNKQNYAYIELLAQCGNKVDWAQMYWGTLVEYLESNDNRLRSIACQLLCNLSQSVNGETIVRDFDKITALTYDERFVTLRHSLLSIYKIAFKNDEMFTKVIEYYKKRFMDAEEHKNCTLIRSDIVETLQKLHDYNRDGNVKKTVKEMIEKEKDVKYKKKYEAKLRKYI